MTIPFERTCFVVMPFGAKPVGGKTVDFDAIYEQIFLPAIQAVALPGPETGHLEPRRTDQDRFAASITQDLFEYLEYSRIVLADISGLNANVLYELGVRHRARASGTAIIRQSDAPMPPFDISHIKALPYDYAPEEKVKEARALVTDLLRGSLAENRLDSPVNVALAAQREHGRTEAEGLLREAEDALRVRDLATAALKLMAAVERDPRNPLTRLKLGVVLRDREEWGKALAHLGEAVRLSPRYADALREMGIVQNQLFRRGQGTESGEQALRAAVEHSPNDFDAHSSLGGVLKRLGKAVEALQSYRRAADVSQGHSYPLLNALKLEAEQTGKLELTPLRKLQIRKAAAMLEAQVATRPVPANVPWCFFDLAEISLYRGDVRRFTHLLDESLDYANAANLTTFRESLERLARAGVELDGLQAAIRQVGELEEAAATLAKKAS